MKSPQQLLGVPRDATLVEIKRAYARVLKLNRPDDDPDAFGAVQAAFEACVAHFRRREAGIDDEDDYEEEAEDEAEFARWEVVESGSETVADATSEVPQIVVQDAVSSAVDAIVENARNLPTSEFESWLTSDDRFYALEFKRAVGDLAIERMSWSADQIPWQTLAAVHSFFEVDSIADPRLRNDFVARETWMRVQADARFHKRVQAMRNNPYNTFAERIVLPELFDPPDRRRSRNMHLYPTLPGQLRQTFQALSAEDPDRAEAALSSQARDYWLPLTDPAKVSWRRIALAACQSVAFSLPLAALFTAFEFSIELFFGVWGSVAGIFFGIWLVRVLFAFFTSRYSAWRLRTVGTGEVPAGANLLADRVTVMAGGAAALSLCLSLALLYSPSATTGLFFQVWLVMFMSLATIRAPRFRWEASLAVLAVAWSVYPLLAKFGSSNGIDTFFAAGPGTLAIGTLCVLLVDALHGRLTTQALADVRDATSLPQCGLAILAILAILFSWVLA